MKIYDISQEVFVGFCYVVSHNGNILAEDAVNIALKAKEADQRSFQRILNAAPLNLEGSDGSPCRAILIECELI